jgi:hypothetical protein
MTHVFISYVRENEGIVQRLCEDLTKYGVKVWLDKNEIKAGTRWRDAIRAAIEAGDYFIACFSKDYNKRHRNYMNHELSLAIQVLSEYSVDRAWFIPVLLEKCDVPSRSIGGAETLLDLQWVSLYLNWDEGIKHIIDVVQPAPIELQRLGEALYSKSEIVKESAISALGETHDTRAILMLGGVVSDEKEALNIRKDAIKALAISGNSKAIPILKDLLSNKQEILRIGAAIALAKLGDVTGVSILVKALYGEFDKTKVNEEHSILYGAPHRTKINDENSVLTLLASIESAPELFIHTYLEVARIERYPHIPSFKPALVIPYILEAVLNSDPLVRARAFQFIRTFKNSQLSSSENEQLGFAVLGGMNDSDERVRYSCIEALTSIKYHNHEDDDALIHAMKDKSLIVWMTAAGMSASRWRDNATSYYTPKLYEMLWTERPWLGYVIIYEILTRPRFAIALKYDQWPERFKLNWSSGVPYGTVVGEFRRRAGEEMYSFYVVLEVDHGKVQLEEVRPDNKTEHFIPVHSSWVVPLKEAPDRLDPTGIVEY